LAYFSLLNVYYVYSWRTRTVIIRDVASTKATSTSTST